MDPIKSVAPDGDFDGGFYAVTGAGHLVSAATLKPGMRWATQEEIDLVRKLEADRAAKEAKLAAKSGPLKGA